MDACTILLHAFRRNQCPAKSRKYLAPLVKGSTGNESMHSVALPLRKDGNSAEMMNTFSTFVSFVCHRN